MINEDLPLDTFEQFFSQHLSPLEYDWPAKPNAQAAMQGFRWHEKPGNADEAIELKQYLTNKWAVADRSEKEVLAKWIVASWGGVGANKPETIKSFVSQALDVTAN